MHLQEKVKSILVGTLGGEARLDTLPNGRICGHVISPKFLDLDYPDRRRLMRDALDEAVRKAQIAPQEVELISMLLTYTPEEWDVDLTEDG